MKKLMPSLTLLLSLLILQSTAFGQSIVSHFVVHSYDVCGTYFATIETSGYAAGQRLNFHWGDGTTDTVSIAMPGGLPTPDTANTLRYHSYSAPGTYTMKVVLYDGAPLDSVTFTQEVEDCRFLLLHGVVDVNANCLPDAGDEHSATLSTIEVDSAGVIVDTFTMTSGMLYRSKGGTPGTIYTYRVITPPAGLTLACGLPGIVYDTVPGMPYGGGTAKYFLYECSPSSAAFDLAVSASFRSSVVWNIHAARILVSNSSCVGVPTTLQFDFSPKYAFDSLSASSAITYTVSGTTVIADLGSVSNHSLTAVQMYLHPVVTLTPGDTVYTSYTVTPITGDSNPTNNSLTRCDTINLAWDPNQKSVTPTGPITAGTLLEYMLEFENTGNDTAHNIHIMDTLSDYLDFNTFTPGTSTHRMVVAKYKEGPYNIVKFDFPNIMLPDSSHHDVCKGMATFSIRAKSTLTPGTTIANRAGIYFDINEVVMTNTVYSNIPLTASLNSVSGTASLVEVFPNPVNELLNIRMEKGAFSNIAVYNIIGQQVLAAPITGAAKINVSMLPTGIYYLKLHGKNGKRTIKFEKL